MARHAFCAVAAVLAVCLADPPWVIAHAADEARIIASEAASPFARELAKALTKHDDSRGLAPEVKVMPSARAAEAFCRGTAQRPAVLLLTRKLNGKERKACAARGRSLTELLLGRERLALAQAGGGLNMQPSLLDMYLALAARVPADGRLIRNPYHRWDEVNPSLPVRKIRIVVPASGGAREILVREVLQRACRQGLHPYWDALKTQLMDDAAFEQQVREHCSALRDDDAVQLAGTDAEAGRRLAGDAKALGLLGAAALRKQGLQELSLGGGQPHAGEKGGPSRPVYLYAMGDAGGVLGKVLSNETLGPQGALTQQGLLPLPEEQRARLRKRFRQAGPPMERAR